MIIGPFWICVTLVFCIAIMGNIADYMQSGGEGQHWRYDFRKGKLILTLIEIIEIDFNSHLPISCAVSISATTIFCYALLVPLLLWYCIL